MASLRGIKRRIRSVSSTARITHTIELVSAAKLRKAQQRLEHARVYANTLARLLREQLPLTASLRIPLVEERKEVKRSAIYVIAGERGLCAGYNAEVQRALENFLLQEQQVGREPPLVTLFGRKMVEYYRRAKRPYWQAYEGLPDDVFCWPIDKITREVTSEYEQGNLDAAYLVYTSYRSTLSMQPIVERILPVQAEHLSGEENSRILESTRERAILFEPSMPDVFKALLPRIVKTHLVIAFLEAKCGEYASRMLAMDSASHNGTALIGELTIKYNKLRQEKITSELLDVIGGVENVSR